MPGMSNPSSMPPSYSESCLPHGMAIPNNLSITRVPYPGHGMNQKPMGGPMGPQPPWMHPSIGPHVPHAMHPHYQQQQQHYSASMINEMEKKKRGRPRKNQTDGMPGGKSRGGKSKAEDNKDMYDFEDDDSKTVQPLRPKRQNEGRPPNNKDTDYDEDGKQMVGQPQPMIHATQGFRQVQEKTGMVPGMTNQLEGYGQPPPQQPSVGVGPGQEVQEGQEGDDNNEKSVSYTSKIEETPKGGIKLKIKIKKSASPVPSDPEPPSKKPKTDCYEGVMSGEAGHQAPMSSNNSMEETSIMNTMNEMQRLANSGISRPSSVPSDYHPSMSPSPLKSPHSSLASPNSPHTMRPHMMKPGIPGGAETRGATPPGGQHQGMRPHGSNHIQQGHMPGYQARVPNPHHPAMQNNYQNQGSHMNNMGMHHQHQMSQQQPQRPMHPQQHHPGQMQPANYGDYNSFNNRGYNNFMDQQQQQQQQQMYNRQQQYDQHMSAYRPGMPQQQQQHQQQMGGGMGGQMRPGYMPQQMLNPRYPGQQHSNMDPMARMAPGMAQRMHHPSMMRPMMGGHPGHPGHPGHGYPTSMSTPNSVMPPNISPGSMHQTRSPHPQNMGGHPQTGHPQTSNDGRSMFQGGQYRMGSPQYPQGQQQNFNNSPTSQGYPPTPGGYQQPLTPGYQKPPTPQSHANPPTPQSSHNPLTPGSYPNPSTPGGSYPNPTTPGSYPNPTTPVSYQNPLTPQPPQSPAAVQHQMINNDLKMPPSHQNNFNPPKNESVIQPNIFKDGVKNPMLSPPMSNILTSDLRKIRRPSKSVTPGTVSPNQKTLSPNQIKTEIKPDPDADMIKKEASSPATPASTNIKTEPIVPKVEKQESPKPPPPKAKTPEPYIPMEPKWGEEGPDGMPEKALKRVFQYVCYSQGCLPFLLQAMRICKLWAKVAKEQSLWTHANLGNKIKEKSRTEKNLEWILKNKFPNAVEVDVSNWRAAISAPALKIIAAHCPNLIGLGLSQCVKLSHEDVRIIPSLFPNLQKVDVSVVAVSWPSLKFLTFTKNFFVFTAHNCQLPECSLKFLSL